MAMPGFSGEASLGRSGFYAGSAENAALPGSAIIPQQYFESCERHQSCWGVVLGCRDHCNIYGGGTHSSLWFVCGVCFGLFEEFFEFDF
jgi:hypothetical protein